MLQLALTLIAIAAIAVAVASSIEPPDFDQQRLDDSAQLFEDGAIRFSLAYQALTREGEGAPPTVSPGGFAVPDEFVALLRMLPSAPAGFTWGYGHQADPQSVFVGWDYVCAWSPGGAPFSARTALQDNPKLDPALLLLGELCGTGGATEAQLAGEGSLALTYYLEPPPAEADEGMSGQEDEQDPAPEGA